MSKGSVFVVSAPSGAGKTTLCKMAVDKITGLEHSVSYTTRTPRDGETDGVDYNFTDEAGFKALEEEGEFVENALVHGNRYGTRRSDLNALVEAGIDVMVEIDVQGARQLKANLAEAIFIFILPPSPEACRLRLKNRGQDTDEVIEERCAAALSEIKEAEGYNYLIINDDLNEAFSDFDAVIKASRVSKDKVIGKVRETFDI